MLPGMGEEEIAFSEKQERRRLRGGENCSCGNRCMKSTKRPGQVCVSQDPVCLYEQREACGGLVGAQAGNRRETGLELAFGVWILLGK